MYDAIVVGAGPAGSACALRLARTGLNVVIVERSLFPRTKACGEYLNLGALAELDALGVADVSVAGEPIHGIRLYGLGLAVELPLTVCARGFSRRSLDARLLQTAIDAGASMVHGRVEDVDCAGDGVRVTFRAASGVVEEVRARMLVGADGMESTVARKTGMTAPKKRRARFAVGGHFGGFASLDGFVEMYVDRDSYFAVNPLGGGEANIMVVVHSDELLGWRGNIDERLRQTAVRLSAGRRTFSGVKQLDKRVAIGPLDHRTHRLTGKHRLLVGDAGEFVDPFTGQGVFLALSGARRAAEAIVAVLC
ncbi:MAG: NAD(P)/FAD-dependent oxidoreductase, partial [Candidatus Eremiobacteraeota bacterium]|nr:NAD(P)/FAD-dependent oxidoreductase [Candidatus Eremiobacteraeota bacterium]